MALLDKLRNHWLGSLVVLGATCASVTWIVATEVLVKPRDFTTQQQEKIIADLRMEVSRRLGGTPGSHTATVLAPTWVAEDQPLLVLDDQVQVKVSHAQSFLRSASVSLELPSETLDWPSLGLGETKTFAYRGRKDFFRIVEVQDGRASVAIAKVL